MTGFCALRTKAYAYKLDDDTENKKAKGTKKCVVKGEIKFKNYADALFNDRILIKSQQRFRIDHHRVCTEEGDKIALSSNNDKRIQTFDKVTFPYGTNAFKVCQGEMLSKNKLDELDEDIDISKTKDIVISKTEDIDNTKIKDIVISKTEDIDNNNNNKTKDIVISKTKVIDNTKIEDIDNIKIEDIDNTKTEDKDEYIDIDRNTFITVFERLRRSRDRKSDQKRIRRIVWVFCDDNHIQNYVKSGYIMMVTMHTQSLKSLEHVLVRCFLLENIMQPHQKINQTLT